MSDLIWLSKAQMRRIEPYFPLSHGMPRVDDRRVVSGIIFVIRNGLRWRDAPAEYGKGAALMIDVFPKAKALLGDKGYDADWLRSAYGGSRSQRAGRTDSTTIAPSRDKDHSHVRTTGLPRSAATWEADVQHHHFPDQLGCRMEIPKRTGWLGSRFAAHQPQLAGEPNLATSV
jgi:hypothetical protein